VVNLRRKIEADPAHPTIVETVLAWAIACAESGMIHSLRARLFLVAAVTIAVALGVGLISRRVAQMEFRRFELVERAAHVEALARGWGCGSPRRIHPFDGLLEELSRAEHRE
jgi:hypothetical protein